MREQAVRARARPPVRLSVCSPACGVLIARSQLAGATKPQQSEISSPVWFGGGGGGAIKWPPAASEQVRGELAARLARWPCGREAQSS